MKSGLTAFIAIICISLSRPVLAQTNSPDSTEYWSAFHNTVAVYSRQLGDQSHLYNGSLYSSLGFTFKSGSPYFLTDQFTTGSVVYDGIIFDPLPLLYEDVREFLVTKKDGYLLQLINARISSFNISGHEFVRLVADSSNRGIPRTGFYEVLYPGQSMVLKKTIKDIQETASIYEGVLHSIDQNDGYFVKKGNAFIRVRNKNEFLEVFGDRKKDVQHFIKSNKLNFRKDKENTLTRAAAYFDQTVTKQ